MPVGLFSYLSAGAILSHYGTGWVVGRRGRERLCYWLWENGGEGKEKSELIETYVRVTILTPPYLSKATSNCAIMKRSVFITSWLDKAIILNLADAHRMTGMTGTAFISKPWILACLFSMFYNGIEDYQGIWASHIKISSPISQEAWQHEMTSICKHITCLVMKCHYEPKTNIITNCYLTNSSRSVTPFISVKQQDNCWRYMLDNWFQWSFLCVCNNQRWLTTRFKMKM